MKGKRTARTENFVSSVQSQAKVKKANVSCRSCRNLKTQPQSERCFCFYRSHRQHEGFLSFFLKKATVISPKCLLLRPAQCFLMKFSLSSKPEGLLGVFLLPCLWRMNDWWLLWLCVACVPRFVMPVEFLTLFLFWLLVWWVDWLVGYLPIVFED